MIETTGDGPPERSGSELGRLLRLHRRRLLWTQEHLAADAGVSARTVSDIERGIHPTARLTTLARLANALRLTEVEREQLLAFGSDPASTGRSTAGPSAEITPADLAVTIGAWGVAVTEQEQRIDELSRAGRGSTEELCDAFLGFGRSATLALRRHDARPAFIQAAQLALSMADRDRLVAAAAGYTFMTKVGDPVADADDTWRRGLLTVEDDDVAGRAIVTAARATAMRLGERERNGHELATYALGLARSAGSADALAVAISTYVMATWGTPNVWERRQLADELADLPATMVPFAELAGVELSAYPRLESGDVDGFERCAQRLRTAGAELRHPYAIAQAEAWDATIALLHGEYEDAERRSSAAASLSGHAPNFTNGHLAQVFSIRLAQGRAVELLPQLAILVRDQPDELAWRAAWAVAASRHREHREEVAEALLRVQHEFWPLERTWTFPVTAAFLLDAACNVGNIELVELLAGELRRYAGSLLVVSTATACEGAVEHYLGRAAVSVGDADRGLALLDKGREHHVRLGSPHLVARSDEAIAMAHNLG